MNFVHVPCVWAHSIISLRLDVGNVRITKHLICVRWLRILWRIYSSNERREKKTRKKIIRNIACLRIHLPNISHILGTCENHFPLFCLIHQSLYFWIWNFAHAHFQCFNMRVFVRERGKYKERLLKEKWSYCLQIRIFTQTHTDSLRSHDRWFECKHCVHTEMDEHSNTLTDWSI